MKYILFLLSLVFATHFSMAQTTAGDFDTTFGNNGRSRTSFSDSPDFLYSAVMQPDGKTIAVGGTETIVEGGIVTSHIVIARYSDNGNVDPSFGVNGIQTLLLDEVGAYALSVALQADGKILLTGTTDIDVFLARLQPDGSFDTTFGTNGYVILGSGTGYSILVQPDNKILVAGNDNSGNAFITRCLSDGILDTDFGNNGTSATSYVSSYSNIIFDLIYTTDNKIIATGQSCNTEQCDIIIGKYNNDGTFDTSFDTDGKIILNFEAEGYASNASSTIELLPDNKFIVIGSRTSLDSNSLFVATQLLALRYNTDGTPDLTFGNNGVATTNSDLLTGLGSWDYTGFVQADGKVVYAGAAPNNDGGGKSMLARWNADGSTDNTFGNNGIALFDIPNSCGDVFTTALPLASNKIRAVGTVGDIWQYTTQCNNKTNNGDLMIADINENGSLDASFGNNGFIITNLRGHYDQLFQLIITDGKPTICASCYTKSPYSIQGFVAQFNPDGTLNPNFGNNGHTTIGNNYEAARPFNMAVDSNGNFLVVHLSDVAAFAMARLLPDGSLDISFGNNGEVTIANTQLTHAYCVATDGDKITMGGNALNRFGLVQLKNNGSLNTAFGTNGITITDIPGSGDRMWTLKYLADGSLLAGGTAGGKWVLKRYTSNGILDDTFDATAICGLFNGRIWDIIQLPNGKILTIGSPIFQTASTFTVAQLNPDGSPDTNFGDNGSFTVLSPLQGYASSMILYPDQSKIVIGGHFNDTEQHKVAALVQLHANGTLDTNFGNNGILMGDTLYYPILPDDYAPLRLAFTGNNKLLVASSQSTAMPTNPNIVGASSIYLAQYLTELSIGILDVEAAANAVYTYPNPLHSNQLTIAYELKQTQTVQIDLYDLQGKKVAQLQNPTSTPSGNYQQNFELPANLSNGIYLLSLQTANGKVSVKITIER